MPRAVVAEEENPPSLLGFPKKAASPNSAVWVGGEKKVSGYQSLDEAIISLFFFLSFPFSHVHRCRRRKEAEGVAKARGGGGQTFGFCTQPKGEKAKFLGIFGHGSRKKVWLRAFERLKEKRRGLFVQSFESVSGFFARFSGKRVGVCVCVCVCEWEGVYGTPDGAHGVGTREEVKESPGGS